MDATHRADLRELNELNFARFDAKLEQRSAELKVMIGTKLDGAVFQHAIAQLEGRFIQSQANLERGLKEQTRFMFLAWSALLIPIIGLWFRG